MTLQQADATSLVIQGEINKAVLDKVAGEAIYSINFRGRSEVTALSAKGAEELYAQCVTRGLCPQIQLVECNDKVVEDQWICDGIWRATWIGSGETYTIDARGSEPYPGGASQDPMSVVNRKAMGKALRNAHLKVVPSVIRESYLAMLRATTGKDVIHSEEYSPREPLKAQKGKQGGQATPHQIVYLHAKDLGLDPVRDIEQIYKALGEVTVPKFLELFTPDQACVLITEYVETHGASRGDNDVNDS